MTELHDKVAGFCFIIFKDTSIIANVTHFFLRVSTPVAQGCGFSHAKDQ